MANMIGEKDVEQTVEHIVELFKSRVIDRDQEDVHIHLTCALDTEAMSTVFSAVKDTLVSGRMAASGISV